MAINSEIKLVIGHNDRGTKHDAILRKLVCEKRHPHVTLCSSRFPSGISSQAKLRNAAMAAVSSPFVLLLDVDIYPNIFLFLKMAEDVKNGAVPFSIMPCLYLTQRGTRLLLQHDGESKIFESYLKFSREYVLHLATPSSVIVLRTEDYHAVGGFDEGFWGHGYEDFDFIIRLAEYHQAIDISKDFFIDKPYSAPLLAEGFRAHLGRFCLQNILGKKFVYHLYHGRNNLDPYYAARIKNSTIFSEKIKRLFVCHDPKVLTPQRDLIQMFFDECQKRGLTPEDYFVLFDARPSHLGRHDWLQRKLRKVFKGLIY
jgi:predicted glycosyltransferase involved in capsule biosynthesis